MAISWLEQSLALCQQWDIRDGPPMHLTCLGYAYALAGRLAEALPLLEQAVAQSASMKALYGHAMRCARLSQGYLLAGRLVEARVEAQRPSSSLALIRNGVPRLGSSTSSATLPRMIRLRLPSRSQPLTSKRWRWPRNSASVRCALVVTSVSASSTASMHVQNRPASHSPPPLPCSVLWRCGCGSPRPKRPWPR